MTVKPISDIVLDVARAADPARVSVAVRDLDSTATDFNSTLTAFNPSLTSGARAFPSASVQGLPPTSGGINRATSGATPTAASFHKLEAFFLQTVIQEIMPKNANSVFGTGTAGDVWKSMLSEHIANKIAASGTVGIATRLIAAQEKIDAAKASPLPPGVLPTVEGIT